MLTDRPSPARRPLADTSSMNCLAELHLFLADRIAQPVADSLGRLTTRSVRAIKVLGQSQGPAVLVVASSQCSPAQCKELTQSGREVIVLAAVPTDAQARAYLAAGAAGYLPMSVDTKPLLTLVDEIDGRRCSGPSGQLAY